MNNQLYVVWEVIADQYEPDYFQGVITENYIPELLKSLKKEAVIDCKMSNNKFHSVKYDKKTHRVFVKCSYGTTVLRLDKVEVNDI